jgi:2-hydroxy-6-oxonona-2,4-dienedioate hydrolase
MSADLIEVVRASATRMGQCDPLWLKRGKFPGLVVTEGGDSGPRVILLHGLFGAVSNWDDVFPLLTAFCRPVAVKFPILSGHTSEVKVKALAALLEYYLRERDYGPVVLCGNSLGGHVALRIALASPALVDCLILSGASGLYEHTADSLPVRPGYDFVHDHMNRVFYNKRFVSHEAIVEVVEILKRKKHILNLIHTARSAKKDNLYHQLPVIKGPTLLLWGEDDNITTMDVGYTFHERMRDSEFYSIKDCGHAPMIEYPEWFAERIKEFLVKHGRLAAT